MPSCSRIEADDGVCWGAVASAKADTVTADVVVVTGTGTWFVTDDEVGGGTTHDDKYKAAPQSCMAYEIDE
eukprot:scaffold4510_cov183-Amphora_coffeaeformis.AAC.79